MKLLAYAAAALISMTSAVSTTAGGYSGWGNENNSGYQRMYRYRVNRLSSQYETGDVKYAACKFHKIKKLEQWCEERNFSATVWVEQFYDAG